MLTPIEVSRKRGPNVFRVRFRPTPRHNVTCETFDTYEQALYFCYLVDRVGGLKARRLRDAASYSDSLTLNEVFARRQKFIRASVRENTIKKNQQNWDAHIAESLGIFPITALDRDDIVRWVQELQDKVVWDRQREDKESAASSRTLSSKTIRNLHSLVSSTFKFAVDNNLVQVNVAHRIPLPPKHAKTRFAQYIQPHDFQRLLKHIPEHWQLFVSLAYTTGLRWSELRALRPESIVISPTPGRSYITVTHALLEVENGTQFQLSSLKTPKAVRTIAIPDYLVDDLRLLVTQRKVGEYLFLTESGRPPKSARWRTQVWLPAIQKAGLKTNPTVHDLRHSYGSALLEAGTPLKFVQELMGHESIQTTADTYGHVAPEALQATGSVFTSLLSA